MAVNERQSAVRTVVSMASRQPGKDGGAVGMRGCDPPAATTRRSLLEFDKNRRSDLPVGQGARSRSGPAVRFRAASRVDSLADIRLYRGGHWRVDRYYGPSSEVISLWGNPRFKRSGSSLSGTPVGLFSMSGQALGRSEAIFFRIFKCTRMARPQRGTHRFTEEPGPAASI
jgi:hypothetical protein